MFAAVALFVVWAASQAGYPVTHWAPGTLIVLALLAIALASLPLCARELPRAVWLALGALALYTLLSYLSIAWAAVPGDAWEGANRTLLYLLVFALFALWAQQPLSAALLLGAWTLAMVGLAAFVLVHVDSASNIAGLFGEGRLKYPAGYENAAAAMWAMVMWPALLLATSATVPWWLRAVFAGGVVLLADLALLSQSRGALYATPVMLVLIFVFVPGRVRTFVVLAPIALAIGLTTPAVLHVGDRLEGGADARAALHTATAQVFVAAAAVAALVATGAYLAARRPLGAEAKATLHRGLAGVALVALVAVLAGGWVAVGNPVTRVRHAWDTFKSGSGYAANGAGNRLTSGLGSNRYDFYRVALDEFRAHPLLGIGADNFQQQYLARGRSDETPHYPHSVELRTLTETGVLGVALALAGLAGALLAAWRAMRRDEELARTVAAGALAVFAYWAVHGSFDWFWEFAGLGAPAFAMLGLACSLAPRRLAAQQIQTAAAAAAPTPDGVPAGEARTTARPGARTWRVVALVGGVAVVLAMGASLVASLVAPYLSALQIGRAAAIWPTQPQAAYARLKDAADLDPLSDEPLVVAGNIALRYEDLARARREFSRALSRVPDDAYATLELGAIASSAGRQSEALELLSRAVQLNPRDPTTREALALARAGRRVNVRQLNESILLKAEHLA
jgi:tetratricopeptide (TPR) repeat protein